MDMQTEPEIEVIETKPSEVTKEDALLLENLRLKAEKAQFVAERVRLEFDKAIEAYEKAWLDAATKYEMTPEKDEVNFETRQILRHKNGA